MHERELNYWILHSCKIFSVVCRRLKIPFWEKLPSINLYISFTRLTTTFSTHTHLHTHTHTHTHTQERAQTQKQAPN